MVDIDPFPVNAYSVGLKPALTQKLSNSEQIIKQLWLKLSMLCVRYVHFDSLDYFYVAWPL